MTALFICLNTFWCNVSYSYSALTHLGQAYNFNSSLVKTISSSKYVFFCYCCKFLLLVQKKYDMQPCQEGMAAAVAYIHRNYKIHTHWNSPRQFAFQFLCSQRGLNLRAFLNVAQIFQNRCQILSPSKLKSRCSGQYLQFWHLFFEI